MERVLIVFAKAPQLGRVKTRLAADIGAEAALEVYQGMAGALWESWIGEQQRGAFRLWVCFDPPDAEWEVRAWLTGADRYLPQVPGNLGHRIAAALDIALRTGVAVAVVGTDAPAVTGVRVMEAFRALAPGEAVLGPSLDGGFYVLALQSSPFGLGELLGTLPWSSSDTLATLVGGLRSLGMGIRLLPWERDLDTMEDLKALRRDGRIPT